MTPPHHPVSSGGGVHWDRPYPETAHSQIFWMQFYPTGVQCHFCSCENGEHWSHPGCFIAGLETFGVAEKLIVEMTKQSARYLPLVYLQLGVLLNLIVRDIQENDSPKIPASLGQLSSTTMGNPSMQTAMDYIETKLSQRFLTVEDIATQAQYSPRHFARLFKGETGMSVMEYVYKRRMQLAVELLRKSTFSVRKIAQECGYVSSSPFTKAFMRHFQCTPTEYRQIKEKLSALIK